MTGHRDRGLVRRRGGVCLTRSGAAAAEGEVASTEEYAPLMMAAVQASHGLQLQSLWMIPTVAVSQHVFGLQAAHLPDCLHLLLAADRAEIAAGSPGSTGATALVNWQVCVLRAKWFRRMMRARVLVRAPVCVRCGCVFVFVCARQDPEGDGGMVHCAAAAGHAEVLGATQVTTVGTALHHRHPVRPCTLPAVDPVPVLVQHASPGTRTQYTSPSPELL